MITQIEINNFRCFDKHIVPLRQTSVIVGKNNAGKSTIIEALKLISIVVDRYKALTYNESPKWLEVPKLYRGVSPSLKGMELNFGEEAFHRYSDPPAEIIATFDKGEKVKVYIGPNSQIFAVILKADGQCIRTKGEAYKVELPYVEILPQVAPLSKKERILNKDYVVNTVDSNISHLHFRNQLRIFSSDFIEFCKLAEQSWKGLQIKDLLEVQSKDEVSLKLIVRDNDFVTECASMGHGLQMWLQTMWFLTRVDNESTIILDEPDVYMHADLQRKLIRMLYGKYRQVIIATHSIEIMSEVEANEILIIDRIKRKSFFADTIPTVQRIIDNIGGVHNIQITRLWASKKCLLVEGKDISILKQIQRTLFPDTEEPFDIIPNLPIGGWGGWNYAVGTAMVLKNAMDEEIKVYCILDHDYHSKAEIDRRVKESKERGVELHIWERKEIENYLIVPSAIRRLIVSSIRDDKAIPTIEDIETQINNIAHSLYQDTVDSLGEEIYNMNKPEGFKNASSKARDFVDSNWGSFEGRLTVVSGKKVLAALSNWSKDLTGVSLSSNKLAREIRDSEVVDEMKEVIKRIELKEKLLTI